MELVKNNILVIAFLTIAALIIYINAETLKNTSTKTAKHTVCIEGFLYYTQGYANGVYYKGLTPVLVMNEYNELMLTVCEQNKPTTKVQ